MILSLILEVAFSYNFFILNSYKFNNINLLEHANGVGYPRKSRSYFWSISSRHLIKMSKFKTAAAKTTISFTIF